MSAREHTFFCIDMKTFYTSVECAERGLNPFEPEDESARSKEPLSVIRYP